MKVTAERLGLKNGSAPSKLHFAQLEDEEAEVKWVDLNIYNRGVKLSFTRGHISLKVAFKGPNVELFAYS